MNAPDTPPSSGAIVSMPQAFDPTLAALERFLHEAIQALNTQTETRLKEAEQEARLGEQQNETEQLRLRLTKKRDAYIAAQHCRVMAMLGGVLGLEPIRKVFVRGIAFGRR